MPLIIRLRRGGSAVHLSCTCSEDSRSFFGDASEFLRTPLEEAMQGRGDPRARRVQKSNFYIYSHVRQNECLFAQN